MVTFVSSSTLLFIHEQYSMSIVDYSVFSVKKHCYTWKNICLQHNDRTAKEHIKI